MLACRCFPALGHHGAGVFPRFFILVPLGACVFPALPALGASAFPPSTPVIHLYLRLVFPHAFWDARSNKLQCLSATSFTSRLPATLHYVIVHQL